VGTWKVKPDHPVCGGKAYVKIGLSVVPLRVQFPTPIAKVCEPAMLAGVNVSGAALLLHLQKTRYLRLQSEQLDRV